MSNDSEVIIRRHCFFFHSILSVIRRENRDLTIRKPLLTLMTVVRLPETINDQLSRSVSVVPLSVSQS